MLALTSTRGRRGVSPRGPSRGLRSGGDLGHRLPKRLLSLISFFIRTRDPTDTVDRLFDSRHINDLRLIVATAFCITLTVFLVAAVNAVSFCLADWPLVGSENYPDSVSKLIAYLARAGGNHFASVFGPALALFGTLLAWAYQRGSNRLGVVDLFACEIDTLCRVITVVETVKGLTDNQKESAIPDHFTSEENYFPVLDGNSQDLQSLEANVVVNITAFYTYMKTVRDTLRRGVTLKTADQRQEALKALVYLLYLTLESGRKAMDDLVEFEPTHTERTMVILLSELKAYKFLRMSYRDENEVHFNRLILRGPGYRRLIEDLDERLDNEEEDSLMAVKRGNLESPTYAQSQWAAALQLRGELDKLFEELQSEVPLDCGTEDKHITATFSEAA